MLNLSITASLGVALDYRRIIATKLQERARRRSAKISDIAENLRSEDSTAKEQAKREIATAAEKGKIEQQSQKETRIRTAPNATKAPPPRNNNRQNDKRPRSHSERRSPSQQRNQQQQQPSNNLTQNQRFGRNHPRYGNGNRAAYPPQGNKKSSANVTS